MKQIEKHTELITFLVTPSFVETMNKAAAEAGLMRSEMIRSFIRTGIRDLGILKGIEEFKQL